MKVLTLVPAGWPCTLAECPPGLFVFNDKVGLKSEYRSESGDMETFCGDSGEYFWGGVHDPSEKAKLILQPVEVKWEEFER